MDLKAVRTSGLSDELRPLRNEQGSELLEYGFVVIVFLMMVFGIAAFGHMMYAYHFVSSAAKEATRFAAVHGCTCENDADGGSCTTTGGPAGPGGSAACSPSPAGTTSPITSFVSSITPPGIDPNQLTVTPTWTPVSDSPTICSASVAGAGPYPNYPGCTVEVTVSYNYKFIFPLIRTTTLPLSSTSEMVIAH